METALEWVIVVLLAVAAGAWGVVKVFGKSTAEEIAKEVVTEMTRDAHLSRVLEEFRGTQRQEFRIKSYSKLWATTDELAIYEDNEIDPDSMLVLSDSLTKWYFGEAGGLMLTSVARDFYFALQDLVRAVSAIKAWEAERAADDPRQRLRDYLDDQMQQQDVAPERLRQLQAAGEVLELLKDIDTREWPEGIEQQAKHWRTVVQGISESWLTIDPKDQFAILQQVSSALRTVLTADLESRIR